MYFKLIHVQQISSASENETIVQKTIEMHNAMVINTFIITSLQPIGNRMLLQLFFWGGRHKVPAVRMTQGFGTATGLRLQMHIQCQRSMLSLAAMYAHFKYMLHINLSFVDGQGSRIDCIVERIRNRCNE